MRLCGDIRASHILTIALTLLGVSFVSWLTDSENGVLPHRWKYATDLTSDDGQLEFDTVNISTSTTTTSGPVKITLPSRPKALLDGTRLPRDNATNNHPLVTRSGVGIIDLKPLVAAAEASKAQRGVDPTQTQFLRAVLFHLPVGPGKTEFEKELKWFHRSWREMLRSQPALWRTDILVVCRIPTPVVEGLGCTMKKRTDWKEPSKCIYVPHYMDKIPGLEDFNYALSISVATWENVGLDTYQWILRSDIDTFLTPAFATWWPEDMVIGGGGYLTGQSSQSITLHRLNRIAEHLKFERKGRGMINVGSTWYGPTAIIREAARISLLLMKDIKKFEFTALEKDDKFWVQGSNWPEWHYGVLSMYSGHITLNHIATAVKIVQSSRFLDAPTTDNSPVALHPHLHTWHGTEQFNKHSFFAGKYNGIDMSTLDVKTSRGYATFIALDSVKNGDTPLPMPAKAKPLPMPTKVKWNRKL